MQRRSFLRTAVGGLLGLVGIRLPAPEIVPSAELSFDQICRMYAADASRRKFNPDAWTDLDEQIRVEIGKQMAAWLDQQVLENENGRT